MFIKDEKGNFLFIMEYALYKCIIIVSRYMHLSSYRHLLQQLTRLGNLDTKTSLLVFLVLLH